MDFLIKKNIIKKHKIIIDIGEKYVKILAARYEHGRVVIHASHKIEVSGCFFEGELSDAQELVKRISNTISRKKLHGSAEIVLSLPAYMVTYKMIQIRNVKPKDLEKHIKKQHDIFPKFNSMTYYTDWAFLGKQERNDETVLCCMVAAVNKAYIPPLLGELEKRKLKVTGISFPTYNIACLSDLYSSDYEHPGRMLLDFGQSATRVVVEYEGAVIYSREIGIGFHTFVDSLFAAFGSVGIPDIVGILTGPDRENTTILSGLHNKSAFFDLVDKLISDWQNELIRIIQMCDEDNMPITKIICCNTILPNMLAVFQESGINTEQFSLTEPVSGSDYTVMAVSGAELDPSFGSAVGLAVHTMQ